MLVLIIMPAYLMQANIIPELSLVQFKNCSCNPICQNTVIKSNNFFNSCYIATLQYIKFSILEVKGLIR